MNHSSSPHQSDADATTSIRQFNTRLGLVLFVIYLLLYAGFVLLNAFSADTMEIIVLAGLNLAIVYGFGLIIAAVFLALIYGVICKSEPAIPTGGHVAAEKSDNEEQQ